MRAALEARRQQRGGHAAWGAFCEEAGEFGLAFVEYQLALRDDENDAHALARLAELCEERGELERALEYARRLVALRPSEEAPLALLMRLLAASEAFGEARAALEEARAAGAATTLIERLERELRAAEQASRDEGEGDAETVEEGHLPSDADVVRFAHLFAGREDVYARQWWGERGEGGYSPVREPFTPRVARNHLLGNITVGVYPVRLDDTVTFCAFDVDITKRALARARGSVKEARRLKALVAEVSGRLFHRLMELGLPPLLEDSGYKGRHLWVFFERPEPARVVHHFGSLVLRAFDPGTTDIHVEFFPKQASVAGGVGNLIKLPLGIHRRTGRRSRLLRPSGEPEPEPFLALRRHPKVPREALHAVITRLKVETGPERPPARPPTSTSDQDEEMPRQASVPAPPAPRPAWTAADFETNPEIAHIFSHCPVLNALKTKVERHRRLTHDEQVVLIHALGHSGAGVLAVNYLLDACVDAPHTARLQTPLSGNPISCPKIRKRIPEVTGSVDCNCEFPFAPDRYPTPRLHLLTLQRPPDRTGSGGAQEPPWDPVDRARALGVLWARRDQLLSEIARLERELMTYMERQALTSVDTGDGTLRLVAEEGAPAALTWEPRKPDGTQSSS
ncbi:MAG TPA: CRISPR-associated primase-polymerase type A1 [Vicinamibacterales bacterium]|nr:CRISPR-associated primase-polymerase type A1 [Vicinamibacterales bacterium]